MDERALQQLINIADKLADLEMAARRDIAPQLNEIRKSLHRLAEAAEHIAASLGNREPR